MRINDRRLDRRWERRGGDAEWRRGGSGGARRVLWMEGGLGSEEEEEAKAQAKEGVLAATDMVWRTACRHARGACVRLSEAALGSSRTIPARRCPSSKPLQLPRSSSSCSLVLSSTFTHVFILVRIR